MSQPNFSRPGAIDLSGLAQSAKSDAVPTGRSYAIDVTEAAFQAEVIERSLQVPVVVEFWSARSAASQDLGTLLNNLATEYDGKFVLARIDIDANPGLAQAVGVQAVPLVIGVLRGQVVPLFQGTADEPQARQYLDQLLTVAVANGITGRAEPAAGAETDPDAEAEAAAAAADAKYAPAEQALADGDVDGAVAAYEAILAQDPNDAVAKQGLAGARLIGRTQAAPPDADAAPDDVAAQTRLADAELLAGDVDAAFARLVTTVQQTAGDDRETARKHLLDLFDAVGPDDPRVPKARQRLMAALF